MSNEITVLSEISIVKCVCEEADGRILRHAINMGRQGYNHVLVKTVDSDVVILSIAYADVARKHGVEKPFVNYGLSNEKCFDIFDTCTELGDDVCKGLPFFHALRNSGRNG